MSYRSRIDMITSFDTPEERDAYDKAVREHGAENVSRGRVPGSLVIREPITDDWEPGEVLERKSEDDVKVADATKLYDTMGYTKTQAAASVGLSIKQVDKLLRERGLDWSGREIGAPPTMQEVNDKIAEIDTGDKSARELVWRLEAERRLYVRRGASSEVLKQIDDVLDHEREEVRRAESGEPSQYDFETPFEHEQVSLESGYAEDMDDGVIDYDRPITDADLTGAPKRRKSRKRR